MSTEVTHLTPRHGRSLRDLVAANVRAELARHDVTQVRVASALGITQQAVSQKLSGRRPFSLDDIEIIAPMVYMTADELVRGTRTSPPAAPVGAPRDQKLPRHDSNVQPAGYGPLKVVGRPTGTISSIDDKVRRVCQMPAVRPLRDAA